MPLARPAWLRVVFASLLLGETVLLFGLTLGLLGGAVSFAEWPLVLAGAVTVPVAIWPVAAGRWAPNPLRWLQIPIVAVAALAHVAVAVVAAGAALEAVTTREELGTPAGHAAAWFAVAAGAVLVLGVLAASLPLPRLAVLAGLCVAVPAALLGSGTALAMTRQDSCDEFRFDPERWRVAFERGQVADLERLSLALVRCDTLLGRTPDELRALLGAPAERPSPYELRWRFDDPGPGDTVLLLVTIERGRAVAVS